VSRKTNGRGARRRGRRCSTRKKTSGSICQARWRPHEEEDGGAGVTEDERTPCEEKRAAVFDEEEDERIDLPGAGGYIAEENYSRFQPPTGSKNPLLPVRITNRE
jgi:hypothetical protein